MALAKRDYGTAGVFDMGESAVNNIHHGLPVDRWLPHVRSVVVSNRERDRVSGDDRDTAYADLLALIDLFADEYGITVTGEPT
ncbi:hypothetical protein [Aeromicrobium sp. 179-A 4D2 NHS]|uniref:hypothetical protein n=1 Tax=Aeromicrobium sp. 179-A 4D2 NHS TaxID=3142375 RepID=UPI0039A1DCAF